MSATVTKTKSQSEKPSTSKDKALGEITASGGDLDEVLKKVKKLDNTCAFGKCKTRTSDFAITCKFCTLRFCTSHALQEIHGCGEAVRRDEKRQYMHPHVKLNKEKHDQASTKLAMKLKQMELERKSKQGFTNKGKK